MGDFVSKRQRWATLKPGDLIRYRKTRDLSQVNPYLRDGERVIQQECMGLLIKKHPRLRRGQPLSATLINNSGDKERIFLDQFIKKVEKDD
jgi:hypothetical protein